MIHLIKIMFNTKLTIQYKAEESNDFKTNIVVLQGDSLSASEFILYLSRTLQKMIIIARNRQLPIT